MSSLSVEGYKDLREVNVRLLYGLRSIGKSHKAAKVFCGLMNLPPPPTKFERYNEVLGVEDVCFKSWIMLSRKQ